jgi:transcriptional regulator with XRE-family HTH domain
VTALLKEQRINKKISQSELASNIGVTRGYISQIENNPENCNPSVKLILKLSKELGIHHTIVFEYFAERIHLLF